MPGDDPKKPLIAYHANCIDGFCAAWIAWRVHRDAAEYRAVQYGQAAPSDVEGRDLLILDFSYPREQLIALADKASSILVLDHHKTARADLEGLPFCIFDMDRSGAA